MERPFDYPGRHSDIVAPDPYDLKKANDTAFHYAFDHYGGNTVRVTGWFAPEWWTRDDIENVVDEKFPYEQCYHAHDCCGHHYSSGGDVIDVIENVRDDNGEPAHLVLVRVKYVQNV
jgi:hypothetical protein